MNDKILVTRSSMPPFEEYAEEIRELWDSHWITNMGEKHRALEEALKGYLGVPEIMLFSNGHLALELSIEAMGLKGEIITTPFTFASTTWAILRAGCTPVFCDIDPETLTMDPSKIEALITERTSAILPVHVYGHVCDTDAIGAAAKKHGLKVIYDAAHAFGVRYRGRGIGTYGDLSMFSFHATKVFNTIEGGAACFGDASLSDPLFRIKNFGIQENETYQAGCNAKMNEFQAAMGLCNLRHIGEALSWRKRIFERYTERLSGKTGLFLPKDRAEAEPNYAYFPVVIEEKEFGKTAGEVCALLNEHGIFPRRYFSPLTNDFSFLPGHFDAPCGAGTGEPCGPMPGIPEEALKNAVFDPSRTPFAKHAADRVITLPIYEGLPVETADLIADLILGME